MMNSTFDIINLGKLKFLISIVDFDYPRTFACKKDGSGPLELYLFDERDHGDDYIEWVCVRIVPDDLDRLNSGLITLESLFFGPRKSKKAGYRIISKNDGYVAKASLVDDISCYVSDNQTYVDMFIEDNHGASLLSLIYEKPIVAIIAKPEKYADPMIDATRVTSGSRDFKSVLNSMPYAIESRNNRMAFSQTHSVVMYFEVSDKKLVSNDQNVISEDFEQNEETHSAFDAIDSVLKQSSSNEEIINAFKGDKKSIGKVRDFISEIKKNNKGEVNIRAVDYSRINSDKKNFISCNISKDTVVTSNKRLKEVSKIIDEQSTHIINEFSKVGQFLMLDTTGRKKFKFQSIEKSDDGVIYSGFSDTKISGFSVDDNRNKKYKVTIKSDILKGEFGISKPIYTLIKIDDVEEFEQINLI